MGPATNSLMKCYTCVSRIPDNTRQRITGITTERVLPARRFQFAIAAPDTCSKRGARGDPRITLPRAPLSTEGFRLRRRPRPQTLSLQQQACLRKALRPMRATPRAFP